MLIWIELGLVLLSIPLALFSPYFGSSWFCIAEHNFAALARHRRLSILVVGLVALAARAAVLPVLPIPQPQINDEFSHLLLADTLAHGRLANPTPPMWIHFETFHVIMHPTYASMYPPAQGALLAAGELLAHLPFLGVWLSTSALCAMICWMLQAWMPPTWALIGGLIAVVRIGVFSYWANSYWGGAASALGGALLLGTLPRIVARLRSRDALLLGLGLTILANSRPYEGLVISLPVAAALVSWICNKKGPELRLAIRRVIAPLALALMVAAACTAYYFWRVTGNPFRMPQQVDRDTYGIAPYFLWQSPHPAPQYHYEVLRNFYTRNELNFYRETQTFTGLAAVWIVRILHTWFFYLGPALTFPLLMALAMARYGIRWGTLHWQTKFIFIASMVSIAGLGSEVFFFPHYAAPMTGLLYIVVLAALRRLHAWRWNNKPTGMFLARAVPAICLLLLVLRAGAAPLHIPLTPDWPPTWYNGLSANTDRARVQAELDGSEGKHLVIVRYRPDSKLQYDWVYNKALIDKAKTIWARDMGASQNQELIEYFKDRHVWLIEPDENPPRLVPYSSQPASTGE